MEQQEIQEQYQELEKTIHEKVEKVEKRIADLQKKFDDIMAKINYIQSIAGDIETFAENPSAVVVKYSKQALERQLRMVKKKMTDLAYEAQKWLNQKMAAAMEWVNKATEYIKQQVQRLIQRAVDSIKAFLAKI